MNEILKTIQSYHEAAKKSLSDLNGEVEHLRKSTLTRDSKFQASPNELLARADELYKLDIRAEYYRGILDFSRTLIRQLEK